MAKTTIIITLSLLFIALATAQNQCYVGPTGYEVYNGFSIRLDEENHKQTQKKRLLQEELEMENEQNDEKDDEKDGEVERECENDESCPSLHVCTSKGECIHKPLFPLTGREIFGICVILVLVGFAQAGGIGGGPILMPILLGILNYGAKEAIALSFVLIFGGSCGNFLNNSGNQTQYKTPLIWYDLVLVSLPLLMSGAILGVALNHFLANSIIVLILIYVLYNSFMKTKKKYHENVQQENLEQSNAANPLLNIRQDNELEDITERPAEPISIELQEIYELEKIQYPKQKFIKILAVVLVIVIINLLKGGKGMASILGIAPCGIMYWFMNLIIIGICIVLCQKFAKEMMNYENDKEKHNFDFKKFGDKFDEDKIQDTCKAAITAGVVGGLLGLGGGVILTPKWLHMGIPNDRTAATATFTVVFTSFISFFSSFLGGKYVMSEVAFFWIISFIASYLVANFIKFLVRKYKKKSIITLILLIVISIALFGLPFIQIFSFISDPEQIYTFGTLC